MDYQAILNDIGPKIKAIPPKGEVASYIPELAKISPNKLGVSICGVDGGHYHWGDAQEKFSIQSVSKVFSLALAVGEIGEKIWKRINVEPSGNAFNSLVQLEYENGIPRNPLLNSGALVICDILLSTLKNPHNDYLAFVHKLAGDSSISYSEKVAKSEKSTGFRNTAVINLMKAFGNIENDTEVVLDFYYNTCSIEMNCHQLAQAYLIFANDGKILHTGEQIILPQKSKRINAIMQTCGFYDESGEFTFRVGLPGKSGVGGGIVAICPGQYSVAVWSPVLNEKGNSYLGTAMLEMLTSRTDSSIF